MKSRVLVARHALHPMLIVFPLGLLGTSVAWDICYLATGQARWGLIAFWTIVAGVIGAVLAAVPGFIDWLAIPARTRAKRVGLYHMVLNLVVLALFAVSLLARYQAQPGSYEAPGVAHMIWGWLGVGLALVSGWLGGELVERHGIGVDAAAHPNAPSSLTTREA
jgi:uncharacterized membrane protein